MSGATPTSAEAQVIPVMRQTPSLDHISEHELFLRLFITNGGGW